MVVEYLQTNSFFLFEQKQKFYLMNLPSKILVMIPGPSSTESGLPVRKTGSPTVTPAKFMKQKYFKFFTKILFSYKFLRRLEL